MSRTRKLSLILLSTALAFAFITLSGPAEAQRRPAILKPSTRPMWFSGGVGAAFYDLSRGRGTFGRRGRFKAAMDFGYHFSGDGEGPAIGASLEQTFADSFYTINPAFKFLWDIQILDMAVYIAPFAKAGYAFGDCSRGCRNMHAFNIGIGVEGRVVLHDRALLFLRPVQVDTFIGRLPDRRDDFWINYSLLLGGGFTF
jgi:hypothetical protein